MSAMLSNITLSTIGSEFYTIDMKAHDFFWILPPHAGTMFLVFHTIGKASYSANFKDHPYCMFTSDSNPLKIETQHNTTIMFALFLIQLNYGKGVFISNSNRSIVSSGDYNFQTPSIMLFASPPPLTVMYVNDNSQASYISGTKIIALPSGVHVIDKPLVVIMYPRTSFVLSVSSNSTEAPEPYLRNYVLIGPQPTEAFTIGSMMWVIVALFGIILCITGLFLWVKNCFSKPPRRSRNISSILLDYICHPAPTLDETDKMSDSYSCEEDINESLWNSMVDTFSLDCVEKKLMQKSIEDSQMETNPYVVYSDTVL